ncbi:MAG: metN2 [Firmicutes bacterium]|nr:metN2 [Bacillota bacterium]
MGIGKKGSFLIEKPPPRCKSKQFIMQMARELSINFMILSGEMESYGNSALGSIIINVPNEHFKHVKKYLLDNNVVWQYIDMDEQVS